MNGRNWLALISGFVILMTGLLACAKAERAVVGTRQFIQENRNPELQFEEDDPLFWNIWTDRSGGG
jgi:hypothetical protein